MQDDDRDLEAFFTAARATPAEVSEPLAHRILADALAAQESAIVSTQSAAPTLGWWRSTLDMLGGWPMAAGMATATIVGVMVGVSGADVVSDVYFGVTEGDVSGLSGFEALLEEL